MNIRTNNLFIKSNPTKSGPHHPFFRVMSVKLIRLKKILCVHYYLYASCYFHFTKQKKQGLGKDNLTIILAYKRLCFKFHCKMSSYQLFMIFEKMKWNSVPFFVAINAISLFILCFFFLEEWKKRARESNGDKKINGVPFHHLKILESKLELLFYC